MNVYDTANNLAKEIKSSEEYTNFKTIKNAIASDSEKKNKLDEFEKLQYENQISAMQGKAQDENKMKELQQKYAELITDEQFKKYFESEMKFNVMLSDVNKIIAEAVREIL